jgi:hypothetical protein
MNLAKFAGLLMVSVPMTASCDRNAIDDLDAQYQITTFLKGYQCADYYDVGMVTIQDKMMNAPSQLSGQSAPGSASEAIVQASTALSKTAKWDESIGHAGMFFALARCSNDWLGPSARFGNLTSLFANDAVGTPVGFVEDYRFQKWQSGWRLVGIDNTTRPVLVPTTPAAGDATDGNSTPSQATAAAVNANMKRMVDAVTGSH